MIIVPNIASSSKEATFVTTINLTGTGNYLWGTAVVGNNFYVGDNSNPGKVFIVNTTNNTQTGSITLAGSSTGEMVAAGTNIYVTIPYSQANFGSAITIDTTTNTTSAFYQYLGDSARYIASDSTGDNVYVAQGGANTTYSMRQYRSSGAYSGDYGTWFIPSPTVYGYSVAMVATSTTVNSRKIYQSISTAGIIVWRGDGTRLSTIASPAGTLESNKNYFSGAGLHYVGSNKAYIPGAGDKIWVINTSTDTISTSIDIPMGKTNADRVYNWSRPMQLQSKSRIYYVGTAYNSTSAQYTGVFLFEFDTSLDAFVGVYALPQISANKTPRSLACNSDGTKFFIPEYGASSGVHVYSLPA